MPPAPDIKIVRPEDEDVAAIIRLHLSGMIANSPAESVYALNGSGLSSPDVTLFGAFEGETCLSIGALKMLNQTSGEIKSMRTLTDALGRGFGKAILKHIIGVAKQRGFDSLFLETGTGESFAAAHHIYRSEGFVQTRAFGDYMATDFNRFYLLDL